MAVCRFGAATRFSTPARYEISGGRRQKRTSGMGPGRFLPGKARATPQRAYHDRLLHPAPRSCVPEVGIMLHRNFPNHNFDLDRWKYHHRE